MQKGPACSQRGSASQRPCGHCAADASATPGRFGADEEDLRVLAEDVAGRRRSRDPGLVDGGKQSNRRGQTAQVSGDVVSVGDGGIGRDRSGYRVFQRDGVRRPAPTRSTGRSIKTVRKRGTRTVWMSRMTMAISVPSAFQPGWSCKNR